MGFPSCENVSIPPNTVIQTQVALRNLVNININSLMDPGMEMFKILVIVVIISTVDQHNLVSVQ